MADTVIEQHDHIYASGCPYTLPHTANEISATYYYITNLQGDVMHLVNANDYVND